jgi:predicted DNA binding CopG/RHH family protein
MAKYDPPYIDNEEKEFMEGIRTINPRSIKRPTKLQQNQFRRAAKSYVEKESKMNIRIDSNELAQIKQTAQREGLKYQTLVKSVLHKYITGQLIEKRNKAG